jgi:hypothetical protein
LWFSASLHDFNLRTEAEFLDEIQTKVLRIFLLVIQSPLQLCLEIFISPTSRNLLQFLEFSYYTG